jgi:Nickel responsive protein SCO4226-like
MARSFVVEVYAPCSRKRLADAVTRARAAAREMTLEGTAVRYRRSIAIPEDETCFHVFEGPSAEAVVEASRRAELVYARIVEAVDSRQEEEAERAWDSTRSCLTGHIRRTERNDDA